MKTICLAVLCVALSACGSAAGSAPSPVAPSPDECTNTAPNITAETDGSYTDALGCETTVLNHQVISNVQGAACVGWC